MHLSKASRLLSVLACAYSFPTFAIAVPSPPPSTVSPVPSETASPPACTASSAALINGGIFDLRPDMAVAPTDASISDSHWRRRAVSSDYHVKGFDYGANFTFNICGAVVEPVSGVVGVEEPLWANVSAYYTTSKGEIVSIGQASMDLVSRGRMLVLSYTGGSPCNGSGASGQMLRGRDPAPNPAFGNLAYKSEATDRLMSGAEGSLSLASAGQSLVQRRKSTIFSFHCDRDPTLHQASVSFVGTPDECAYFFEVRTQNACPRSEATQVGSIGPGSVFALIFGIAVIVYILGGVFYNRTVAHARGWRQLPNYSIWAAIWNSVTNALLSVLSLCAGLIPRGRGYRQVPTSPSSRSRNREAENRLIEQLDEEWDEQ